MVVIVVLNFLRVSKAPIKILFTKVDSFGIFDVGLLFLEGGKLAKVCVGAVRKERNNFLVDVAVVELRNCPSESVCFGLVARVIASEVHDVWVGALEEQELDGLLHLVLHAEVKGSVAIPVNIVNFGPSDDEFASHFQVVGKKLVHKNRN